MGWSGGSDLARDIIASAKKNFPDEKAREEFYKEFLEAMENHDWDTQCEATDVDPVFDAVLRAKNKDRDEEDCYEDESQE